jgi:hypothetical protein
MRARTMRFTAFTASCVLGRGEARIEPEAFAGPADRLLVLVLMDCQ